MNECVLVVDDDREIVKAIAILLEKEGYQVCRAYDGLQALDILMSREVHLILMDIMMPKLDGLSALMKIREQKNLPVIVLSAKGEETDKILGLSMGADDYIAKPYLPQELVARVRSHLRRYMSLGSIHEQAREDRLENGRLSYSRQEKTLYVDGELVALSPIEELGGYTERLAPIWCITTTCENPEGVFKYFIESMMDGGDMQTLWTYGVEGVHWSTKAETVCGNTYEEGEFHMLESLEKPGTQYTKATMDPTLSIVEWDTDPGQNAVSEVTRASQELFNANCVQEKLVPSTTEMATYNGDLTTLKRSIVADVVVQGVSLEEAYARFEEEHGAEWSQRIVDSLNEMEQAQQG